MNKENLDSKKKNSRRRFLKGAVAAGGAAAVLGAAGEIGAPFIGTAKAQTKTWKIQTSWPGGIGLELFKDWCNSIVEKSGGELAFTPFGAKDVVG